MKDSLKVKVAAFLENTPFLNSRAAFRAFTTAEPTVKVKQTYFYTLFTLFGTRETKKEKIITAITSGKFKNCMAAYKTYKENVIFTRSENLLKPVAFAYFLNVWKKHFNITGGVRTKKIKEVKAKTTGSKTNKIKELKVAKVVEVTTPAKVQIVEISKMTAREILAKVTELVGAEEKVPTNVKDKAKIVKVATKLFINAGYKVK